MLGEAIYFARGLGCPLEYFHGGFRPAFEARWQSTDFASYLASVHRHRTDPTGVFSVKLFWLDVVGLARELAPKEFDHLRWTSTQISLAEHRRIFDVVSQAIPNPTFVFLFRRDDVRQAVSLHVAGETKTWRRLPAAGPGPAEASPGYSFHRIVRYLASIQNCNRQWLKFFRANGLHYIPLAYEDLAEDYEATLRELFLGLDMPEAPIVPPRLHKQADATSEKILEKFLMDFRREVPAKIQGIG